MKLFSVFGDTIREGIINNLYVSKTKEEAMNRFEKEFGDNYFYYIDAIEIEEIDGYKIYLEVK